MKITDPQHLKAVAKKAIEKNQSSQVLLQELTSPAKKVKYWQNMLMSIVNDQTRDKILTLLIEPKDMHARTLYNMLKPNNPIYYLKQ